MDFHLPIFAHLDLTGSAYRGQALGGLGAGTYKDYVYRVYESQGYFRTLDDMGGWLQAKQKVNQRLEFNEAIGIDNVPGYQLRHYFAIPSPEQVLQSCPQSNIHHQRDLQTERLPALFHRISSH